MKCTKVFLLKGIVRCATITNTWEAFKAAVQNETEALAAHSIHLLRCKKPGLPNSTSGGGIAHTSSRSLGSGTSKPYARYSPPPIQISKSDPLLCVRFL